MKKFPIFIDKRITKKNSIAYRSIIQSALILIASIKKTRKEVTILELIREIRHCSHLGSAVRYSSGIFYIGKGLLEKGSTQYIASCIFHDAYHLYQYHNELDGYKFIRLRGNLNGKNKASIERAAIRFQLGFKLRLGLTAKECDNLRAWLKKPYYYRTEQKERTW